MIAERAHACNYIKREAQAGRVAEDSANTTHNETRRMLDTFASVGATQFDVTWTTRSGDKDKFRRGIQIADRDRRKVGGQAASTTSAPGPSPSAPISTSLKTQATHPPSVRERARKYPTAVAPPISRRSPSKPPT